MSKIFKPKKPEVDPEQEKLLQEQRERAKSQESEIAEAKAAKRKGSAGRTSLITGAETGIPTPSRTTMG